MNTKRDSCSQNRYRKAHPLSQGRPSGAHSDVPTLILGEVLISRAVWFPSPELIEAKSFKWEGHSWNQTPGGTRQERGRGGMGTPQNTERTTRYISVWGHVTHKQIALSI